MRIIAGKYKRKKLVSLPGTEITRPTTDRVKENIFNILQEKITDRYILDLYSGSGALGLEALSRGAKKVIFVEKNQGAIECIKKNLRSLNTGNEYFEIYHQDVSDFLNSSKMLLKEKIHIIFADPPYNTTWYRQALLEIENSNLCYQNCLVILEMPVNLEMTEKQDNWRCIDIRKYGKTKIEIWSYNGEKN